MIDYDESAEQEEEDGGEESSDEEESEQEESRPEMNKEEFEFEQVMGRAEAVSYLEAVVEGVRQGKIQLARAQERLELSPANLLTVEVEASRSGNQEKLELELKWQVIPPAGRLRITPG